MSKDVVIAVDVGTPLAEGSEIKNVLNIVEQMTSLMIQRLSRQYLMTQPVRLIQQMLLM